MPLATPLQDQLADLRERFNRASDTLPPLPCAIVQVGAESWGSVEFQRRLRQREKTSYVTEQSYFEPCFLYGPRSLGLVSPGLKRTLQIAGSKTAVDRFRVLSAEAGRVVTATGDDARAMISPDSIAVREPELRWVCTVFDLAWAQKANSPLTAPRLVEIDGRIVSYDPAGWRPFLESDAPESPIISKERIRDLVRQPPDCFWSEMPDLMRASVHAIDLLAEHLEPTLQVRDSAANADDEGASRPKNPTQLTERGTSGDELVKAIGQRFPRAAAYLPADVKAEPTTRLDESDCKILDVLADKAPQRLTAEDIAPYVKRSPGRIRARLRALEAGGFVRRPAGERSGYEITAKGLAAIERE